jgi:hypothetical protein
VTDDTRNDMTRYLVLTLGLALALILAPQAHAQEDAVIELNQRLLRICKETVYKYMRDQGMDRYFFDAYYDKKDHQFHMAGEGILRFEFARCLQEQPDYHP